MAILAPHFSVAMMADEVGPNTDLLLSGGEHDLGALLRTLEPVLNDGLYAFVCVSEMPSGVTDDVIAMMYEPEGLTLVLRSEVARSAGLKPLFEGCWITLQVHSSLVAVGLTATFSAALTRAGISCNVIAGAYHDHLFVLSADAERAMACLHGLHRGALDGGWTVAAPDLDVRSGYRAGLIGRVAELHARYYAEHWGFGATFEAQVARGMSDFIDRYDADADGIWVVMDSGEVAASVTLDAMHVETEGAHLRWFITSDAVRGRGAGGVLLERAVEHCRERGYGRMYLWTFAGLHAARHLYERAGFRLTVEQTGRQWATEVTEQRFDLDLSA